MASINLIEAFQEFKDAENIDRPTMMKVVEDVFKTLLRKKFGTKELPFKMWLFPVPVIISLAIWIFLFISPGWFALWGSLIAVVGVIVYFLKNKITSGPQIR